MSEMKPICKILLFLIPVTTILVGCNKGKFDGTGYKVIEFQDAKFKNKLLDIAGVDQNGDGEISFCEITLITDVDCSGAGITHATELRLCWNATTIDFTGNNVSDELKLSKLFRLETADFSGNSIKGTFDISQLQKLTEINLGNNKITSIVANGATMLTKAYLGGNNISGEVDMRKLTNLSELDLSNNPGITKLILHEAYMTNPGLLTLSVDAGVELEYRDNEDRIVTP